MPMSQESSPESLYQSCDHRSLDPSQHEALLTADSDLAYAIHPGLSSLASLSKLARIVGQVGSLRCTLIFSSLDLI